MPTDLRRARTDLATFAHAIEQPLTSWQAGAFAFTRRTTVVIAPRQSGKSRSLSVAALHWAYSRPDQRVLIVSAGEDASRRLLASAAAIALRSPLLSTSVLDESASLIRLSNGSEVRSVPASERAVRGWSVDLLLCDEAVQIDPGLLLSAALPTTAARPDARIVLASSPGDPEGPFFDFAESESESIHVAHWSLEDATWITPEVVEQAREQLPPSIFGREYLGEFTDAGDETIIERAWITQAQERTLEPSGPVVFGVDLARGGDESVAVRLAGGQLRVVWGSHDPDLMRTAARIVQMAQSEIGPEPPTWLDVTGLGHGVYDRCRELGMQAVQPFVASARARQPDRHANLRAEAWFGAREAFRLGLVDLDPADKLLAAQLAVQRFVIAPSTGALQVASKTGKSPDRADAAVIALHAKGQHTSGMANIEAILAAGRQHADAQPRSLEEEPLGLTTEELWSAERRRPSIVPYPPTSPSYGDC